MKSTRLVSETQVESKLIIFTPPIESTKTVCEVVNGMDWSVHEKMITCSPCPAIDGSKVAVLLLLSTRANGSFATSILKEPVTAPWFAFGVPVIITGASP